MMKNNCYNNDSLIITLGSNFEFETKLLKTEILDEINSKFTHKKSYHLNFQELIIKLNDDKDSGRVIERLTNSLSINLDFITCNSSICLCLLGETVTIDENDKVGLREQERILRESMKTAISDGHEWLENGTSSDQMSLTEILALYLGKYCGIKYPLFYFRVSGGPIDPNIAGHTRPDFIENPNPEMERLKKKLIVSGLSIQFYGSCDEFKSVVQQDLERILDEFDDRTEDIDNFAIYQHQYQLNRTKHFVNTDQISLVIYQINQFLSDNLSHRNKEIQHDKLDSLLADFFRKDFSNRLGFSFDKLRKEDGKSTDLHSACDNSNQILLLLGPRGSGKSSVLSHWIAKKKNDDMIKIYNFTQSSTSSTDVRIVIRNIIQRIRRECGCNNLPDSWNHEELDNELVKLSGQLQGALYMLGEYNKKALVVIDGLDYLIDKCSTSTKYVKNLSWLPLHIPVNVKFIFTCTETDFVAKYVLNHFKSNPHSNVRVKCIKLDYGDVEQTGKKEKILRVLLKQVYNQEMPEQQLELLQDWGMLGNPLIQKMLAHAYHTLSSAKESWLSFLSKLHECNSIVEFIRRLLVLWIRFSNWEQTVTSIDKKKQSGVSAQNKRKNKNGRRTREGQSDKDDDDNEIHGWVPDCFSLLALAPSGISVPDLLACLQYLGYNKDDCAVSDTDIWSLYHMTAGLLLELHDGKLHIPLGICRETVEHTFLSIASCSTLEARSYENHDFIQIDRRHKLHLLLAQISWNRTSKISVPESIRSHSNLAETMHHLDRSSAYDIMSQLIFQPRVILSLFDLNEFDLAHDPCLKSAIISKRTHIFLSYLKVLNNSGINVIEKFNNLIQFTNSKSIYATDADGNMISQNAFPYSQIPKKSTFTERVKLNILNAIHYGQLSQYSDQLNIRFQFVLAQVAFVMHHDSITQDIATNILQTLDIETISNAQILWWFVTKLRFSQRSNDCTNTTLVSKMLYTLENAVEMLYVAKVAGADYIKCQLLVNNSKSPRLSQELPTISASVSSIPLQSLILELQTNSLVLEEKSTPKLQILQQNIHNLSEAIRILLLWTGPNHCKIADLLLQLGLLWSRGNYHLKMKAEACYRCAQAIWNSCNKINKKSQSSTNQCQYHSNENSCKEALISLLFHDLSRTSLSEAQNQLMATINERILHLGISHPMTQKMTPLLRFVHEKQKLLDVSYSSKRSNSSIEEANKKRTSRPVSTRKTQISAETSLTSNMQFLKMYTETEEKNIDEDNDENNELDYNQSRKSIKPRNLNQFHSYSPVEQIMLSRPISRNVTPKHNDLRRSYTTLNSTRSSPLTHIYLNANSSIKSLVTTPCSNQISRCHSEMNKDDMDKNKQVRFLTKFDTSNQNQFNVSPNQIEKKIRQLKQRPHSPPNYLDRRIRSANFSRPYQF